MKRRDLTKILTDMGYAEEMRRKVTTRLLKQLDETAGFFFVDELKGKISERRSAFE